MEATSAEFLAARDNGDGSHRPLMLDHDEDNSSQLETVHLAVHDSMSRRHGYLPDESSGYHLSSERASHPNALLEATERSPESSMMDTSTIKKIKSGAEEGGPLSSGEGSGGASNRNGKGGNGRKSSDLIHGSAHGQEGEELSTDLKTFGNLFIAFVGMSSVRQIGYFEHI